MSKNKHIIHRVNLEIEAPDPKTARQVQEDAIRILKNDILPLLEKYLDIIETGNRTFRFNEFNLNLADIRAENFEAEFTAALINKFKDQIEKIIDPQQVPQEDAEPVTKLTHAESDFERFFHFLRTGRLPWWTRREDAFPDEQELLKNPLLAKQTYRKRLIMLLLANGVAFERLLLQFTNEFAVSLVLSALNAKNTEKIRARTFLKENQTTGSNLKNHLIALMSEFQQKEKSVDKPKDKVSPDEAKQEELLKDDESATPFPVDGIFVQNAGLVLLHPFLEYFFMEFKLLMDQKFVNRKAQTIAIHLLHYLATGQENPMEYELLFEKYLCGWDLDKPVPRRFKLSKAMKTESEKLLNAAIGHWKALKKTSPNGLREGFLQREGKLVLDDFQHRLIVEGSSTDVLLSLLPWGYGMIKLPWLAQILIVDWNH
jgi:hypothetical protein